MVLTEEVTEAALSVCTIPGDQPVYRVSLATMKDLSARLEPTRPNTSSRVPEQIAMDHPAVHLHKHRFQIREKTTRRRECPLVYAT